jgi:protein-tyrosine phosphatase
MTTDDTFRLLVMCTANQCRSPMAQALAGQRLFERGVRAEVRSCGVLAGGAPPTAGARKAMAARGLDLSAHVSCTVEPELLARAQLVLTMERRHLVELAELDPGVIDRAFTLRELDELSMVVGPRRNGQTVDMWVAEAAALRDPSRVLTADTRDDVPDPMGGSRRAYRRTADDLDERITRIVTMIFPTVTY